MGKTPDEVIEVVGRPESTSDDGSTQYWYYYSRTIDNAAGKTDNRIQVVFRDGVVDSVNY